MRARAAWAAVLALAGGLLGGGVLWSGRAEADFEARVATALPLSNKIYFSAKLGFVYPFRIGNDSVRYSIMNDPLDLSFEEGFDVFIKDKEPVRRKYSIWSNNRCSFFSRQTLAFNVWKRFLECWEAPTRGSTKVQGWATAGILPDDVNIYSIGAKNPVFIKTISNLARFEGNHRHPSSFEGDGVEGSLCRNSARLDALVGNFSGPDRRFSSPSSLADSFSGFVQGLPYVIHAGGRNPYAYACRYEHKQGPLCHVPLGLKVLFVAPLLPAGFWIAGWGLNRKRCGPLADLIGIAALFAGGALIAASVLLLVV